MTKKKKPRKPSIIQNRKECYICHTTQNLQLHHVFAGNANKPKADAHGFTCYLCFNHHVGNEGVHTGNTYWYKKLQKIVQAKYEETHSREEFMEIFGKNYLD